MGNILKTSPATLNITRGNVSRRNIDVLLESSYQLLGIQLCLQFEPESFSVLCNEQGIINPSDINVSQFTLILQGTADNTAGFVNISLGILGDTVAPTTPTRICTIPFVPKANAPLGDANINFVTDPNINEMPTFIGIVVDGAPVDKTSEYAITGTNVTIVEEEDVEPPAGVQNLSINKLSAKITWTASASEDVVRYEIYSSLSKITSIVGLEKVAEVLATDPLEATVDLLSTTKPTYICVVAVDEANNKSIIVQVQASIGMGVVEVVPVRYDKYVSYEPVQGLGNIRTKALIF